MLFRSVDNLYANTYSSAEYTITATILNKNIRQIDKVHLIHSGDATGAGTAIYKSSPYSTFQAYGTTSAGAGAATILIQGSNDKTNWVTIGTISLTLSTSSSTDAFANQSTFKWVRSNVSAISGTDATVSVIMGV